MAPGGQGQPGIAIAGFVCGLISLFTTWCLLGLPLAVLGIVFGVLGRNQAAERRASPGLAIAGLVCGILGIVSLALVAAFGNVSTNTS